MMGSIGPTAFKLEESCLLFFILYDSIGAAEDGMAPDIHLHGFFDVNYLCGLKPCCEVCDIRFGKLLEEWVCSEEASVIDYLFIPTLL